LEQALPQLPGPLAFALGLALAELEGLGSPAQGGWLAAPPSAELLPAGAAALTALDALLQKRPPSQGIAPFTVKWKVAAGADAEERAVLEQLLARLPAGCKLRLDANGGWDRATAQAWAERLAAGPRLDWLEQPLAVADPQGLERLAALVPVALDESLRADPALAQRWRGWQVRRPASEGDPRPLLASLQAGTPNLCLSTAFETGIGRRLLAHLAALQAQGPTPTAPGLAPGWRPQGELFAADPERVWRAVG
jgi:O-succinylbenzoate synthase